MAIPARPKVVLSILIVAANLLQTPPPVERLVNDLFAVVVKEGEEEQIEAVAEFGKDAIPTLTRGAHSGSASERTAALWCLQELADKSTGPLVFALASSDPERHVRNRARVALGSVGSPEHIDALLGWAAEGDAYSVRGLGECGDPRVIPLLASLIGKEFPGSHPGLWVSHDPDNAGYPAADALARLGEPGMQALEKAFDEGSEVERKHVLEAFPFGEQSERFLLKFALQGGPKGEAVLYHVVDAKSPELLKKMLAALDADPSSKVGAYYAIQHNEWKAYLRAAERVLAAGGNISSFVYDLADKRVPGSAPFLLKAIRRGVTEDVIKACEVNHVTDALPLLVAHAKAKKALTPEALGAIASFGPPGLRALDRMVLEGSLAADDLSEPLYHVKDPASIPILRGYLADTKSKVRLGVAIEVLGRLGDRDCADRVVKLGRSMPDALGRSVTWYLVDVKDSRAHLWVSKNGHYFNDKNDAKPYALDILAHALAEDIDLKHLDWIVDDLLPGKDQISPGLIRPLLAKDDGRKGLALWLLREIGDSSDAAAAKREIEGGNVLKRLEAWRTWKKLTQGKEGLNSR